MTRSVQRPFTRPALLAASSLALVAVASVAVLGEAAAQEDGERAALVPVTFGTDPGQAHPRYAARTAYDEASEAGETGGPVSLSYVAETAAPTPLAQDRLSAVTVAPGDTVYAIARAHDLTPAELIAANGLVAPYRLSLGQTLTLPAPAEATRVANPERVLPQRAPDPVPVAGAPAQQVATALIANIERIEGREKLDALYAVRPGDTLFGLSRRFGVPVGQLADANALQPPYALSLGQRLIVPAVVPATPVETGPLAAVPTGETGGTGETGTAPDPASMPEVLNAPTAEARPEAFLVDRSAVSRFDWPLKGAVLSRYGETVDGQRNDGINMAAPAGTPIRAAASGEVVYRGDELAGYGNLLLVKHQDGWVSAYAHAGDILVKKGDTVTKGQVVARVGATGAVDSPQLHFELRHDLQPQDPVKAMSGSLESASLIVGR